MAGHKGIELKNIVYEPGENRSKISADIFIGKNKVGEVFDDGWCDELYIEFIDDKSEKLFNKRRDDYCNMKNFNEVMSEDIIRELIYEDRMRMIKKEGKKSSKRSKQLNFLE